MVITLNYLLPEAVALSTVHHRTTPFTSASCYLSSYLRSSQKFRMQMLAGMFHAADRGINGMQVMVEK
jgi:hypothetical protein